MNPSIHVILPWPIIWKRANTILL